MHAANYIQGTVTGHAINWLPITAANTWRVAAWCAIALIAARLAIQGMRGAGLASTRLYRLALTVMLAQRSIGMLEHWNERTTYEGLPLTSLALLLTWLGTRRYDLPDEHRIRSTTGVGGRW